MKKETASKDIEVNCSFTIEIIVHGKQRGKKKGRDEKREWQDILRPLKIRY